MDSGYFLVKDGWAWLPPMTLKRGCFIFIVFVLINLGYPYDRITPIKVVKKTLSTPSLYIYMGKDTLGVTAGIVSCGHSHLGRRI